MKVSKTSIIFGLVAFVVVILVGVATFLLIRGILQFNESETRLNQSIRSLESYYVKKPFPSDENIGREKTNVVAYQDWYVKLTERLKQGQIEPVRKTPSTFMSMLQDALPALKVSAVSNDVALAGDLAFGFEKYFASSSLPDNEAVERLTQQLMIIEKLCDVLFSSKISQLSTITREVFEESGSGAGIKLTTAKGGGSQQLKLFNKEAGRMGEQDLYAKFHFIVEFRAREQVVWTVLNRLAKHELFIVVTAVDVKKEGDDVVEIKQRPGAEEAAKAGKGGKASGRPAVYDLPSRAERVVSGPEMEKPASVRIELDVYRFRGE